MFTGISWTDYLVVVVIALFIYYLFVGVRYFSADLQDLFSGKRKLSFKATLPNHNTGENILPAGENRQDENAAFEETTDDEFAQMEHLIERLRSVIRDASERKLVREEFKQYLHLVLNEYPAIKNSPLRSSINELVVTECEKYGAVTLGEDEMDVLWNNER
ncbi:MAG: hypothetical protein AB2L24_23620 [Mangrovibacterium sp.]